MYCYIFVNFHVCINILIYFYTHFSVFVSFICFLFVSFICFFVNISIGCYFIVFLYIFTFFTYSFTFFTSIFLYMYIFIFLYLYNFRFSSSYNCMFSYFLTFLVFYIFYIFCFNFSIICVSASILLYMSLNV